GDGATELSEDSTKGHRFVTGITQAANGKITYQVTDIYTPGLSISDTGTGTFMTGISVSDHKITVSRANPTAPNNGALNIYISNTSTNGTQDLCDFTANKSTASNVYLNNIALTNSANTFSGNQTAPAWYISSDINYKDIIDDCRTTLDEIAELPIFDYTWKLDESKTTRTGSSAQAVEKILPNLITEDNEGIKSLDYATLGTVAGIIACREIKNLKDKIDRLERLLLEKK
ncbi:MAG: tail fiber domain-containing protein, partial [Clostridia bacterium]|nr:tail fiber domain-containing protein [Clostridia bacterium]